MDIFRWNDVGRDVVLRGGSHSRRAGGHGGLRIRIFPGLAAMDGNWAALLAASNGKVYVGLACHGCNGHLVYFDPRANRMVDVGDFNQLTGEDGLGIGP